jgi:uncharacterized protein YbjT (DUF2867 family)
MGATGRTLTRIASQRGLSIIPHVRPHHVGKVDLPAHAAVFELGDTEALVAALSRSTTIIQLVGTMRRRFAAGDTYDTSDIGTTAQLLSAARQARTIDHVILLTSVGAGSPVGAYLAAKARAERVVVESGIPYTIFRPSLLMGEGRAPPPLLPTITRIFGPRFRAITLEELSSALLRAALDRAPTETALEGRPLWQLVETQRR